MDDPDAHVLVADARAAVDARIGDLAAALAAIVAASEAANLDDEHDPEGATVGFERAQVAALLGGARTRRAELEAAANRLRAGDYGTCAECGAPIGAARLVSRPETMLCVTCASRSGSRSRTT